VSLLAFKIILRSVFSVYLSFETVAVPFIATYLNVLVYQHPKVVALEISLVVLGYF
jgi:hypothetical protein